MVTYVRQASLVEARFPDMSPEERSVWDALQAHRGRVRAVTGEGLCEATGLDWRACRKVLKALVEVYRKRVGSGPANPPGYFLIEKAEELDDVCKRYRKQALSLLRREAILRRTSLEELLGQMQLEARYYGDGKPAGRDTQDPAHAHDRGEGPGGRRGPSREPE